MSEDPITGYYKEYDVVTPSQLCVACLEFTQDFRKHLEEIIIEGISSVYSSSGENHPPGAKAVWPKTFAFHHNLRSLKSSLEADCHLCTLLWLTVLSPQLLAEPTKGFDWDRSLSIQVKSRSFSSELRGQEFHLSLVEPGTEYAVSSGFAVLDLNLGVQAVSKTSSEQQDRHIPMKEAFSVWTGSPTSLKLAKSWIKSCVTEHAACIAASSSHKNAGSRPTRLVDVSSGTELVRVCSAPTEEARTADRQPRDRQSPNHLDYVTLSHAWGGAEFVKLTTQNYARLCDQFSIQELPKTWRDAICLTRSLGYRYIWVDALCIIQDSLCDWEVESDLMGQVYEHCHLNIAALGSTSSNDGLFRFRNPLMFKNCCLRDALGSSGWPKNHYLAMAVIRPPNYHGWDFKHLLHHAGDLDYIISLRNEPLNKRGWVIQERGLSPRTLYFGKAGLFWDCRERERQEMWADTLGSGPHFRDPEPTNSKKVFSWRLTYSGITAKGVSFR
ncbi:heterokaryon incompatibility protein [Colletotrichum salicis]|uniref:Heterokaryon incompatibility protein n=1 Tax=Colletotrichum salicis TaxID=1209931 RepID=A0A135S3K1_9PEZI|nr:heterokaryon incompatibility protein [Colletotrichum salicis]